MDSQLINTGRVQVENKVSEPIMMMKQNIKSKVFKAAENNSKIIFLISQQKHTLLPLVRTVSTRQF